MPYHRVLLKISGEALMGENDSGVSPEAAQLVASKIRELQDSGIEVAIVIGGGNIFRAVQQGISWGMDRSPADQIGMLATLMNGVVLRQALSKEGCDPRLMSALDCPAIAEKYNWDSAMRYLGNGSTLIFVGGTGHPYFTTDTTAALRSNEIKADIFLKATTKVDGIYDKDPVKFKDAKKFSQISYSEVLQRELGILDLTAITLCMSGGIPIRVFNFYKESLLDAVSDKSVGTLVS